MAKLKFILDTRERKKGTSPVMLFFRHGNFRKQASLGITVHPENWDDETGQVSNKEKNHRHINQRLTFFRTAAEGVLLRHYGLNSDGATMYADEEVGDEVLEIVAVLTEVVDVRFREVELHILVI